MNETRDRSGAPKGFAESLKRAVLLNGCALVLVVGTGEAVVRSLPPVTSLPSNFSYEPGRKFRYSSPPRGTSGAREYDVEITLNRYGFNGPDHPPRRRAGTARVALIGDSMVEAFQVSREEGLSARLEARMPGTEVLGFGMSGHATMRQAAILERLPVLLADAAGPDLPDLTLLVVHGPYAVRQTLVDFVRGQALWRRGLSWGLRQYSGPSEFLLQVRDSVLRGLLVPTEDLALEASRQFRPGYTSGLLDQAWLLLGGAVADLATRTRGLGMCPVFVYIPDASEMGDPGEDFDPLAIPRRFEGLVKNAGAGWIDLTGPFRKEAGTDGGGCFFQYDAHPTAKGHDLAARLLAERLRPLLDTVPLKK